MVWLLSQRRRHVPGGARWLTKSRCRRCLRWRSRSFQQAGAALNDVLIALQDATRPDSAMVFGHLGVGAAVGLSKAANVFVGMVEVPLLVKPYLAHVPGPCFAG
jgi:hypothetical protein